MVRSFAKPAAVVVKHNNPCGAAVADSLRHAAENALAGDPVSAFGSVLGFNRCVDLDTAQFLATPGLFIEAIVAPQFAPQAVDVLTTQPKWKNNVRLMQVGHLDGPPQALHYRYLSGGLLVQDPDLALDPEPWRVVTEAARPNDAQWHDLRFAWEVARHVKSNAIVLARAGAVCGVGAGQMSRVDAVELAIRKAGERARGAVLASDGFFPFPDSIELAAAAGIAAIVQPGGSKGDDAVFAASNTHRLPMLLTNRRHFKH
jgi:phosphoribosylaminoimidazolecarboxamide formyltransferase/IMP cyclohydrolase